MTTLDPNEAPRPRPSSGSTRRVRRFGLSLLPSRPLVALRRIYESATAPRCRASGELLDAPGMINVSLRPPPLTFSMVPESRPDLEEHLRSPRQAAELAAFMEEAASPGTLFDVGAHDGLFSVLYCLTHQANQAVAFEPSPQLSERIGRNARLNFLQDRLAVASKAVAEASGTSRMLVNDADGYVQILPFRGRNGSLWHPQSIETTTLDAESMTRRPSIVKIDVEGYEWEVLKGAAQVLEQVRPVVFLELHLNFLEERRISPVTVVGLLVQQGYVLLGLDGRRVSERQIGQSWANVLHLIARPAETMGKALGHEQAT